MSAPWESLLRPYQVEAAKWLAADDAPTGVYGRMLADGLGLGKALALDTPIPTPSGFVKMRDLRVGDLVLNAHGESTPVEATFDVPTPNGVFDVYFVDGEHIRCCGDHLWWTWGSRARKASKRERTKHGPRVMSTHEVARSIKGNNGREHAIPVAGAWVGTHRDLPLDPYFLGVWLGDGDSRGYTVTLHVADESIARAAGLSERVRVKGNAATWNVPRDIRETLKHLNLSVRYGTNKHIPEAFLWSSRDQRLRLLQGLMDTDGCIAPSGNATFDNTSFELATGVRILASSLGIKTTWAVKYPKVAGRPEAVCTPCYRVHFTTTVPVFLNAHHKATRVPRETRPVTRWRYIDRVVPVEGREPMKCITVPGGLYLCGETGVVTHNTRQTLAGMRYRQENGFADAPPVVCTTASARIDWANEVRRFWPELTVCLPGGASANYQRKGETDEAFVARTEGPWREALKSGDPTKIIIVNYENMKLVSDFALEHSALLDVTAVDEAHNLKRSSSMYSRNVRDLTGRSRRLNLLTATPIDNRPHELWNLLDMCAPNRFGSFIGFCKKYFLMGQSNWGLEVNELMHPDELKAAYQHIYLRRTAGQVFKDLPARIRHLHHVDAPNAVRISPAKIQVMRKGDRLDAMLRETVRYKLKAAADYIRNEIAAPTVAYTYKREDAETFAKLLEDRDFRVTLSHGDIPVKRRMENIEAWKRGESDVIVSTMDALRESATLVRAKHMVFVDLDWRFVKVLQCEGRIDPARQPENERCPVAYHYFLTRNGPDEVVAEALLVKIRESQKLLNDPTSASFGEFLGPLAAEEETIGQLSDDDLLSAFVERTSARTSRLMDLDLM